MNTKRKNILLEKHNRLAPIDDNQLKLKIARENSDTDPTNEGPPGEAAILPLNLQNQK